MQLESGRARTCSKNYMILKPALSPNTTTVSIVLLEYKWQQVSSLRIILNDGCGCWELNVENI